MDRGFFVSQLGTILLYAVFGTFLNALAFGMCIYVLEPLFPFSMHFSDALAYGSLISAVDPVAVLAIFETIQVNETLYYLVFGESLLNDAVSIVLYQLFISMRHTSISTTPLIFLGFAKFFVVFLGGIVVGAISALLCLFTTKYTSRIPALQPVFVLLFAYSGYLGSESFGLSGIVAILFNGMIISRYLGSNINKKSDTALKLDVKMLAGAAETLVFMYLGLSSVVTVFSKHPVSGEPLLNTAFVLFTLLFCLVWRFVFVFLLTLIGNRFRIQKISFKTQVILSYSGLRGAVAFALAVAIPHDVEARPFIEAATMIEVLFTVFFQGGTIKLLLKLFKIKGQKEKCEGVGSEVLPWIMKPVMNGISAIAKHRTAGGLLNKGLVERVNAFVERYFVRGLSVKERQLCAILKRIHRLQNQDSLSKEDTAILDQMHQAQAELSQDVNLARVMELPQYKATLQSMRSRVHRARAQPKEHFREAVSAVKYALREAKHRATVADVTLDVLDGRHGDQVSPDATPDAPRRSLIDTFTTVLMPSEQQHTSVSKFTNVVGQSITRKSMFRSDVADEESEKESAWLFLQDRNNLRRAIDQVSPTIPRTPARVPSLKEVVGRQ